MPTTRSSASPQAEETSETSCELKEVTSNGIQHELSNDSTSQGLKESITSQDSVSENETNVNSAKNDKNENADSDSDVEFVNESVIEEVAKDPIAVEENEVEVDYAENNSNEEPYTLLDSGQKIYNTQRDEKQDETQDKTQNETQNETSIETQPVDEADVTSRKELATIENEENLKDQEKTSVSDSENCVPKEKADVKIVLLLENANEQMCNECYLPQKCKFSVKFKSRNLYLCSDSCLIPFCIRNEINSSNEEITLETTLLQTIPVLQNMQINLKDTTLSTVPQDSDQFVRKCAQCKNIFHDKPYSSDIVSWEAMEFCNENCLELFQKDVCATCGECKKAVAIDSVGKYCILFGHSVLQFCNIVCLNEYKKVTKVCTYCQVDLSTDGSGFLAPVGNKFRDFCSPECMESYDLLVNKNSKRVIDVGVCSVCNSEKQLTVSLERPNIITKFCCDACFVAYKFVNKIDPFHCTICKKYYFNEHGAEFSFFHESEIKYFCSKTCKFVYIQSKKAVLNCSWCKVKKYNFDMIQKQLLPGMNMCSLHCLKLFQISSNIVNSKDTKCDSCKNTGKAQFYVTMSDATLRAFCSRICMNSFIEKGPATPKYNSFMFNNNSSNDDTQNKDVAQNLISLSQSFSCGDNMPSFIRPSSEKTNVSAKQVVYYMNQNQEVTQENVIRQVIVKPFPRPPMKNKALMCKPIVRNKKTYTYSTTEDKNTQTSEEVKEKVRLIPIPVPIYVPSAGTMFAQPMPVPVPIPLPIPIPILIPTTQKDVKDISKEITRIKTKGKDSEPEKFDTENTDSDAEDNQAEFPANMEMDEDKLLEDSLSEDNDTHSSNIDLEMALTASTISCVDNSETIECANNNFESASTENVQETRQSEEIYSDEEMVECKRQKNEAIESLEIPQSEQQPECPSLNYMIGLHIWNEWMKNKNLELDNFFKNDILELTSPELNYLLCMFIKEIRKPNGNEYAPDTIYYFCLGIQAYLIKSDRFDNIFFDECYGKFINYFDEVAQKFSLLFDDSQYIITRVEEEHLWETKQLGVRSPDILLFTIVYFNTKYYHLTTVDEHLEISFSRVVKNWAQSSVEPGRISLQYYPPANTIKKRKKEFYEVFKSENAFRCPLNLYDFYLSKCPESVIKSEELFYMLPESYCIPDSPVWFTSSSIGKEALAKILNRIKMVREINMALVSELNED